MLPVIQVDKNTEKISVFWEIAGPTTGYRLYWAHSEDSANYQPVGDIISPYANYGKTTVRVQFLREDIGLTKADTIYLIYVSLDNDGVESTPSEPRMISNLVGRQADAGAANSPIIYSENVTTHVAANNPTRVPFTQDVCFVEIFNNTKGNVLYVDITGVDATREKSMPVYPYVYYTMYRNLNKDTGLSLIADGPGLVDARIVIHY